MSTELIVHKGRANTFSFRLEVDNEYLDPREFSKIEFVGDNLTVSTDTLDAADFTLLEDRINVKLGLADPLPLGRHYVTARAYDLQNPQGLVFGRLVFQVLED